MILINFFAGQQWRHREQTYRHSGEDGKEGGVYGESNIETYNM